MFSASWPLRASVPCCMHALASGSPTVRFRESEGFSEEGHDGSVEIRTGADRVGPCRHGRRWPRRPRGGRADVTAGSASRALAPRADPERCISAKGGGRFRLDRRHRAVPRAGDVRTDAGARSSTSGRSASKRFLDEQFDAPMSSYPTLPLYPDDARHGRLPERFDVSARQLHDVPAAEPVLPQRALRARPAAAAGRLRAASDHRRLRRRDHLSRAGWRRTSRSSTATPSATIATCSTRSRSTRRWATTST